MQLGECRKGEYWKPYKSEGSGEACLRLKDELGDEHRNLHSEWILFLGDIVSDGSSPTWTPVVVGTHAAFLHSANSQGRI